MSKNPADSVVPLTDAEITALETLLATPAFAKQAMGLDEMQGFLCAVISGPEQVPSSRWLPAVLGDPVYESAAQAEEVMSLLMRFYGEIATGLGAGEAPALVLNYDGDGKSDEYDYATWCLAYLDGVDFATTPWDEVGDADEVNELLFPLSLLAGEIDPKSLKQIKPIEFATLVAECEDDLPLLLVEIYQYFRSRPAGSGKTRRDAPAVAKVKPGTKKLH
ncbi:MAG: YecA family protein [Betaproteobacteria bacterium]|nr:YecA family protein [Betaproteobacteria bacterium]